MTEWNTQALLDADKRFVWHPFTNMPEWCAPGNEPLVLVEGNGALLRDSQGREYIDGNSSIWTNIHGHNHPHINAAIRREYDAPYFPERRDRYEPHDPDRRCHQYWSVVEAHLNNKVRTAALRLLFA